MTNKFQPYVGPRPFEREDQTLFFGRDHEADELLSLVIAHDLVLLYAQSGAGKTSLLNAGLIPRLEKEGAEVLPLARVGALIPVGIKSEEIPNLYVFNSLMSWVKGEVDFKRLLRMSLVEFLKDRTRADNEGLPSPRIIIFDQFEEVFSFHQDRWQDRKEFFNQVNKALAEDHLLRVVFVIREDYIAQIDTYASLLPEKLRTRFRLKRLGEEAALAAVTGPLNGTGRTFAPGVAEILVEELRKIRTATGASESVEVIGEFVEPVQLQVVCESLWQDLPSDVTVITPDHLQAFGDVDQALSKFYEKAITSTSQKAGVKLGELRRWFEHTLITPAGTRATVFRGQMETGGIPNAAVRVLENSHIIRGEWRGGARWYELTHDRFIEPIKESNQKWLKERWEAETTRQWLEAKTHAWIKKGRGEDSLLNEIESLDAERWFDNPEATELGIGEAMLALVQASRAAIERRRAETKAAVAGRLRRLAFALVAVSLLALAAAILAFTQQREAQANANEAKRQAQRADSLARTAEAARDSAIIQRNRADSLSNVAMLAMNSAIIERDRVRHLSAEAIAAKLLAEKNKESAEKAQHEAQSLADQKTQAYAEIERLNQGYMAHALAAIATQQQQLNASARGALLARQAYLFNLRSAGEFRNEVYEALRKTLNAIDRSGGPKILSGHKDWVTAVAFNPTGSILASASADSTIRLWKLPFDGSAPTILRGHKGCLRALAFSPDGETLASGSDDHTIRLWTWHQPHSVPIILNHTARIWSVAFSPDGQALASGGDDTVVRLWNLEQHSTKPTLLTGHKAGIRAIAFSPDGQFLVSGGADSTIHIWNLRDLTNSDSKALSQKSQIRALAFSPNGNWLAAGEDDGSVLLWDTSKLGTAPKFLLGHENRVNAVTFSPDDSLLASGSADKSIRLWNLNNPNIGTLVLREHESWVWSVAFSPDGKSLGSGSSDKTVRLWVPSIEVLANEVCKKVQRNLTRQEWHEFVGPNIPYNLTCSDQPVGERTQTDTLATRRLRN